MRRVPLSVSTLRCTPKAPHCTVITVLYGKHRAVRHTVRESPHCTANTVLNGRHRNTMLNGKHRTVRQTPYFTVNTVPCGKHQTVRLKLPCTANRVSYSLHYCTAKTVQDHSRPGVVIPWDHNLFCDCLVNKQPLRPRGATTSRQHHLPLAARGLLVCCLASAALTSNFTFFYIQSFPSTSLASSPPQSPRSRRKQHLAPRSRSCWQPGQTKTTWGISTAARGGGGG